MSPSLWPHRKEVDHTLNLIRRSNLTQQEKAKQFTALHIAGNPVILYNIWDAGSAVAIASVGAKAIASGSHAIANAAGFEDGERIPLELSLENAARIVNSVTLPVTMDIETGYGDTPHDVYESAKRIISTGIVGINIEDQVFGTDKIKDINEQVERIAAVRKAANDTDVNIFINARTDLFKNADPATHDSTMVETALVRAQAFAGAGANGFFVPGLRDITLIKMLTEKSPLPVNIIVLPGMDSNEALAASGVARISYGPGPYLQMIDWLKDQAKQILI